MSRRPPLLKVRLKVTLLSLTFLVIIMIVLVILVVMHLVIFLIMMFMMMLLMMFLLVVLLVFATYSLNRVRSRKTLTVKCLTGCNRLAPLPLACQIV